ncbi:DUF397 domain-containing protein [Streptomyces sp. NPDC048442]|uniref:DUF397 domain-containing protein n=1 Tax=Streptomyces sp. NPDC048442 TaxID=3154823 RepID=UPI003438717B
MSELLWQKSTFSDGAGDNCINLAIAPDRTLRLRESDAPEVHFATTPRALSALLRSLQEEPKSHA